MLVKKQKSTRETLAKLLNSLPLHQKLICLPAVEGWENAPHRRETTCSVRLPLPFLLKRANPDEDGIIGTKDKSQRYFQNLAFMKLEQKGELGWLIFGFIFLCGSDKAMSNCPSYHTWLWAGQPTLMPVKVNLSDQEGAFLSQLEKRWCPFLPLLQSCVCHPQEKRGLGLHLGSRMGHLPCDTMVPLWQSKRLLLLLNINVHSDFILSEPFCWILSVLPSCPSLTLTLWWLLSQISW